MRQVAAILGMLLFVSAAFAQSDRGTITGTVADPAGAVIPGAAIQVRNVNTGANYQVGSSATGNYVVQVPTGTYEITVVVPGFRQYIRQNLAVPVAQTLRIDVTLQIGANTESVTVTDAAPLLKTESGELAHNVSIDTLNNLPVLGIGKGNTGPTGIRSPYSVMNMLPGANWLGDNTIRLNGMEGNSTALRVEGMDATATVNMQQTSNNQPSVEATEEMAVQTSNYAAEFGQAGGGLFNLTMKSGTNAFHGSAYDYFVNEALNAGTAFTDDGSGHHLRPRARRNNYGFSVGGPVWIPRVYDGHDKTFFFFNWEQYREKTVTNNLPLTVPTMAYRVGDFRQALTGRNMGKDGLGRDILENTIYDPLSEHIVDGVRFRDPYPNNTIPMANIDPVALQIQSFIPEPNTTSLRDNYFPSFPNSRITSVPSVKIDHSLSPSIKLSGYWSRTQTDSPNNTGFDYPIANSVGSHIKTDTIRVNYDHTLTPTVLLHLGGGYIYTRSDPGVPRFDNDSIGYHGTNADIFPFFSVLETTWGGVENMGPPSDFKISNNKPTATASLTWVHGNHTLKFGGEETWNRYPSFSETYAPGNMLYNPEQTGDPSLQGVSLPAAVGFNYASFLLGSPRSGYVAVATPMRTRNYSLGVFAQDTWKVTRNLTVDYGLRYDYQTYLREENGNMFTVSLSTPNPSAGGLPGAIILEGDAPGHCGCSFASSYPFAFQPRLGVAYQINSKTVFRAGVGVMYAKTGNDASKATNGGSAKPFAPPEYGVAPFTLAGGLPFQLTFPDTDPGQQPLPGTVGNPTNFIDRHAGWPARVWQWSAGLQREITPNLVVEASYVGNRGVWWPAQTLSPNARNAIPDATFAARGLDITNPDDQRLLRSQINSDYARERGFDTLPYPGFPEGLTVAQALRPVPQFTGMVQTWTPLGNTWYDSLQTKVTKRFSHGLDFTVTYTYAKSLVLGAEDNNNYGSPTTPVINDVFNRGINKTYSGFDTPHMLIVAGNYTTPKLELGSGFGGSLLSWVTRDWTLGAVLRYQSGLPIKTPGATTNLQAYNFQPTLVNRVPGEPLFLQDLNCNCFDPSTEFVLNPKAWENPPLGEFGTAAPYYGDYRYRRVPRESMSFARSFTVKERARIMIRAEFSNIFNRLGLNAPSANNAFATQRKDSKGQTVSGFGWINRATVGGNNTNPAAATGGAFATPPPREGVIVVRLQF